MNNNSNSVNKNVFYFITFFIFLIITGLLVLIFLNFKKVKTENPEPVNGKSAYELAVEGGFEGSESEYLEYIKGKNGTNGKSAYDLACEGGYDGDLKSWLLFITGNNGEKGQTGKSSYDQAHENGFDGTLEQYLAVLNKISLDDTQGPKGEKGEIGLDVIDCVTSYVYKNNTVFYQFDFKFSDGSKCKKRCLVDKEVASIDNLATNITNNIYDTIYMFFDVTFKDGSEGTIYIDNKYIDYSEMDYDTPGIYKIYVDYKGIKEEFDLRIIHYNNSEYVTNTRGTTEQYIELLDDNEDYNDLVLHGEYSNYYDGSNGFDMYYGVDFEVKNPEMLYKSYYIDKDIKAVRPYVLVYYYNFNYSTYEYEKRTNSCSNVYFYNPDDLIEISDLYTYNNVVVNNSDSDQKIKETIQNTVFKTYQLSDGSRKEYTYGDYMDESSIDSLILSQRSNLNRTVKYQDYIWFKYDNLISSESDDFGIYYKVPTSTSTYSTYLGEFIILSDDFEDHITRRSASYNNGSYKVYNLGIDSSRSQSYYEYFYIYYDKETNKLSNKFYDETNLSFSLSYELDGTTVVSYKKNYTLDEVLELVNYDDFEIGENNIYVYLDIPIFSDTVKLRFNYCHLYDEFKVETNSGLNDYEVYTSSTLEEFLSQLDFYLYTYYRFYRDGKDAGQISTNTYDYRRNLSGLEAYNECLEHGEKFIRNVDELEYDKEFTYGDYFQLYYSFYGSDDIENRSLYIYDKDYENENNLYEIDVYYDMIQIPVGTTMDDLYFDYIMGMETNIEFNTGINYYDVDIETRREWIDDEYSNLENNTFSEPGFYAVKINPLGFEEEADFIPVIVVEDVKEDDYIDTYIYDARYATSLPFIIDYSYTYLQIDLFKNNYGLFTIGALECDYYDYELQEYVYEIYTDIEFPITYEIDGNILTISLGYLLYGKFIMNDENNYLDVYVPTGLTPFVEIERESHDSKEDEYTKMSFFDNGFMMFEFREFDEYSERYPWEQYTAIGYAPYKELDENLYYTSFLASYYKLFRVYDNDDNIVTFAEIVFSDFGY